MVIVTAVLCLTGCKKSLLDKEAKDSLPGTEVLTTQGGMELLLNGSYSEISSRYYYGALLYLYEAAKGPDFFVRNVSGGHSFYTENRYAESSYLNGNAKSLWLQIYKVVRNTSLIIDNIDNVAGDVETLRRIKGEAYALRGLAYFDLSRLFAYPPKFSCTWGTSYMDTLKWGVPIIPHSDISFNILDYEITRSTADETWEYILSQYEMSYALLKGRTTESGHINPAAVLALMMRCYLYMEKDDKVIELGNEWLEQYESQYSLLSYDSYPYQYYKAHNSESVWELEYTLTTNMSTNSINYWVRRPTYNEPGSYRDGQVSDNIGYAKLGLTYGNSVNGLENLQSYSADVRQYLICDLAIQGKDYKSVRRYVGEPYHYLHNIPIIRLPEIYLSMSEAYYKKGSVTEATTMLSKLTLARRQANASITSVNHILNERRREFILEGQTYWDWFRNGRSITNRPVIESISSSSTITFGSISGLSYRAVYPIPLAEMNANPKIRGQQNPGYAPWEFGVEEEN